MGRRDGIRGRHQPVLASGLLIAAIVLSCVTALQVGCANDPSSQRRIATRRAHMQQTIQAMDDYEAAAAVRLRHQTQRMRQWYHEDEKIFQERMRTAGDNIW